MMAETAVEKAVCQSCGVDVRDESLFCYNCGKSVRDPEVRPAEALEEVPVQAPGSRPPLRSAASLRKKRRAFNRQPVEVSWEPPEHSPVAFVIATLVLTIGSLVLLLLAFYLR